MIHLRVCFDDHVYVIRNDDSGKFYGPKWLNRRYVSWHDSPKEGVICMTHEDAETHVGLMSQRSITTDANVSIIPVRFKVEVPLE